MFLPVVAQGAIGKFPLPLSRSTSFHSMRSLGTDPSPVFGAATPFQTNKHDPPPPPAPLWAEAASLSLCLPDLSLSRARTLGLTSSTHLQLTAVNPNPATGNPQRERTCRFSLQRSRGCSLQPNLLPRPRLPVIFSHKYAQEGVRESFTGETWVLCKRDFRLLQVNFVF